MVKSYIQTPYGEIYRAEEVEIPIGMDSTIDVGIFMLKYKLEKK